MELTEKNTTKCTYYILDGVLHKKSSVYPGKIISRGNIPRAVKKLLFKPREFVLYGRDYYKMPYLLENELISINHWIRTGEFKMEPYYDTPVYRKFGRCPIFKTEEEAIEKRFKL